MGVECTHEKEKRGEGERAVSRFKIYSFRFNSSPLDGVGVNKIMNGGERDKISITLTILVCIKQ